MPPCSNCGAKLVPGAESCELCGELVVVANQPVPEWVELAEQPRVNEADARTATEDGGDFKAVNEEAEAGKPISSAGAPSAAVPPVPGNRNALIVGSAAVLLVAGLFLVNALSGTETDPIDAAPRPQMTAVSPISPPPLSPELQEKADEIKNQISTLTSTRRISKQRELIALYSQERRFDLAAFVQQEIASELKSEVEWVRSGNYFYDWMESQTGATRTEYARLAIASYQKALEINPDNLDVRTNMALAYLYDPASPMEAIRNTNMVLEKDPDHILANFNRGVMLMQINRLDQAVEQFARVQVLVGDKNNPVYQRAANAIETIKQHRTP